MKSIEGVLAPQRTNKNMNERQYFKAVEDMEEDELKSKDEM